MEDVLEFKTAFKYTFNRPTGMLYILWILVPIIGWLVLIGYAITLIKKFLNNEFTELPELDFNANLSLGFFMLLKSIPFIVVISIIQMVLSAVDYLGVAVNIFIAIFIIPILSINFFKHETVASYFDLNKVKPVFSNFWDYIIVILKSLGLSIIFMVLILVLVGLPAGTFTKNIFLADFYRRRVKSP